MLSNIVKKAKAEIEKKSFSTRELKEGYVFLKKVPKLSEKTEGTLGLMILHNLGDDIWRVCKMSPLTWLAGPYDLLETDKFGEFGSEIIEVSNTVLLHKDDIGTEFVRKVTPETLKKCQGLSHSFIMNVLYPNDCLDDVGKYQNSDEQDEFWDNEQASMECLRLHCHEGVPI